jgi:hypothetical protein
MPERSEWPTFVVRAQTTYRVAAPTRERALAWFADSTDTDLDVEVDAFSEVIVVSEGGDATA